MFTLKLVLGAEKSWYRLRVQTFPHLYVVGFICRLVPHVSSVDTKANKDYEPMFVNVRCGNKWHFQKNVSKLLHPYETEVYNSIELCQVWRLMCVLACHRLKQVRKLKSESLRRSRDNLKGTWQNSKWNKRHGMSNRDLEFKSDITNTDIKVLLWRNNGNWGPLNLICWKTLWLFKEYVFLLLGDY